MIKIKYRQLIGNGGVFQNISAHIYCNSFLLFSLSLPHSLTLCLIPTSSESFLLNVILQEFSFKIKTYPEQFIEKENNFKLLFILHDAFKL